ncbi:hypothetical protein FF124_01130 [Martelella lutilitoris]|uniref:Uncharacterized protein n=1 Tax=Martelella lutilitoris TaxID=2583532 RepID=A0A5C4JWG1_9HYPH|nr:hypothetical protein [Martelella lutilitoris]TNB49594.1 hypothetical protein FF124_01130 [Martelella lutilitoris]
MPKKIVLILGVFYIAAIGLSIVAGLGLSHVSAPEQRSGCYWQDALFLYVECGPDAALRLPKAIFYNFPLLPSIPLVLAMASLSRLGSAPFIGLLGALAAAAVAVLVYVPIIYALWVAGRRLAGAAGRAVKSFTRR